MAEDGASAPRRDDDEFYLAARPVPPGQRRFILLLASVLFTWSIGLGVVVVLTMRSPGYASWDTGSPKAWTGTLVQKPYPMLLRDRGEQPPAMLVVSMGKRGAHERLTPYFGQRVTLEGYELKREGRHMIELLPEDDAIAVIDEQPPGDRVTEHASQNEQEGERVTLVGEIVDGKCYLGAMKPGDGLGHRSCAVLCLRGGLPPMFVASTSHGEVLYYLLTIDGSTTLNDRMLSMVGTPVIVKGRVSKLHGIPILHARSGEIAAYRYKEPLTLITP